MYDVIVSGARCAGAPTAMLLARQGIRVLLVDRATFPSNLPHGHFIHMDGPSRLKRWGLLDRVVSTGCPPVQATTTDFDDFPLTGTELRVDDVALGYGPRRAVLDKVLVDAAVEAGAELREGFVVEALIWDGERVAGIRGRDTRGGAAVTERARVTVGADGRHSLVARTVKAPAYETAPTATCWYFSYWSRVPLAELGIHIRGHRVIFSFPTNDGLFAVFVAWPIAKMPAVRQDIKGQLMAVVDRVPELAEHVRSGRREERFYGASDLPNFLRRPYGPGWALVGDAGCHKDPFRALGICDALRDAELLSHALADGLAGRCPLEAALAEYERRRNEATLPDYRQNLERARFAPFPAEVLGMRAAIRGDQAATRQFYLANEGMIAREAFFNPDTIRRLMAGASLVPA